METFLSFVPRVVAERFLDNPTVPAEACEQEVSGAILFADISGFTALTERLAAHGAAGAEQLTQILNTYFGQLIDVICASGGDILKFAGDALLAFWASGDAGMDVVVRRAAQCGLAAQAALVSYRTMPQNPLSLRIGIGAGLLRVLHVGGEAGRWELVATGDPLAQMSLAKDHAEPGQVALSPEAWSLMAEQAVGDAPPGGTGRLASVSSSLETPPGKTLSLPPEASPALASYMPENIRRFVESGQTEWLAELRRVTVIFINFPGLSAATPLARAQKVMGTLQKTLQRYEGIINKLSVDDKGATLLAAFGLPPLSHEDDAGRAIQAALKIRTSLRDFGVNTAVGIATGQVFCGIIGNSKRREYTMIGDVVNLAARLMQAAPRDILCNGAARESAQGRIALKPLPPITLKGKSQPVPVYRPVEEEGGLDATAAGPRPAMVGRGAEREHLSRFLSDLSDHGTGGVVAIEGEAGIGKSRLVGYLFDQARARGLTVLSGSGDSIEKSTPYQAWREVFDPLLRLSDSRDVADREKRALASVQSAAGPESISLLPLLNPVLSTAFPENEDTAALGAQQRAEKANSLLVRLLTALTKPSIPKLLVFEDGHWIDSASWALILLASRAVPSLLMVVSTRPMQEPVPEEWRALLEDSRTFTMRLQPLTAKDAVELVCLRLGVRSLPGPVEALIAARTDGNPLFSEELAYALRDSGLIAISGEECRLAPGTGELSELDFPGTVKAVITSRIDRLSPMQQLTVKVASAIGCTFEFRRLRDIFPVRSDAEDLAENIRELERKDIALNDPAASEPAHSFKHIMIQDVAYHLMLFAQRRQLHKAMAEWLERTYATELSQVYPLLAHHWSRAIDETQPETGQVDRAVDCLQKAAAQALRSNANREAATFLKEALRLLTLLPETTDRARRELALQSLLGPPLIVTCGFAAAEVERTYSRAWELCRQLGNVAELFPTLRGLWNFYLVKCQLRKAGELARQLFELAQSLGDPELLLPARRALGETSYWLGDLTTARSHLEEVIAVYDPKLHEQAVLRAGQDPGVVCGAFLSWALWLLGYPDRALDNMKRTLALAERLEHPHSISMALQNLTMVYQFRREVPSTSASAQSQMRLSKDQGFPLWLAGGTILQGWALCFQDKACEGVELMESGLANWRSTGAELPVPYYLGLLAEGYARKGEPGKGLVLLAEAIESSNRTGEGWWRAELHRLRGELSLAVSGEAPGTAEIWFTKALEIARYQEAKSLELRAAVSLGRIYASTGRKSEACRMLGELDKWFTEGAATDDLREAASLLETLGEPPEWDHDN